MPITHSTSGLEAARRKVSSFEDNSSASSINAATSVFVIPSDKDNKPDDVALSISTNKGAKALQKSHSIGKTCSMSSGAPIISVSSATDDVIEGPFDPPDIPMEEAAGDQENPSLGEHNDMILLLCIT